MTYEGFIPLSSDHVIQNESDAFGIINEEHGVVVLLDRGTATKILGNKGNRLVFGAQSGPIRNHEGMYRVGMDCLGTGNTHRVYQDTLVTTVLNHLGFVVPNRPRFGPNRFRRFVLDSML